MKKGTISRAVRAALAAILGGKKGNGFIGTAKQDVALTDRAQTMRDMLRTERDGRLYAIAMLEAVANECAPTEEGYSPHSALAEAPDALASGEVGIWRKAPQTDVFKRWIGELYAYGTPDAINGFYVVFTDAYGGPTTQGAVDSAEQYAKLERAGLLAPWGSVKYRDPAKAAKANETDEGAYYLTAAQRKRAEAAPRALDAANDDAEPKKTH